MMATKEVSFEEQHRYGVLNVTAKVAVLLKEVMRRDRGVTFICGPSGTGKTLFAYDYLEARSAFVGAPTFYAGDVRNVVSLARVLARARDAPVLGVLRIPGSTGAVDRVCDMLDDGLPSLPLSVITLRLLPRLCAKCKRYERPYWRRGAGGRCCARGTNGRVRIAEVLLYDDMRDGSPSFTSGSLIVDAERRLGEGVIDVAATDVLSSL